MYDERLTMAHRWCNTAAHCSRCWQASPKLKVASRARNWDGVFLDSMATKKLTHEFRFDQVSHHFDKVPRKHNAPVTHSLRPRASRPPYVPSDSELSGAQSPPRRNIEAWRLRQMARKEGYERGRSCMVALSMKVLEVPNWCLRLW
jgi:hypothetical protein